MTCDSKVITFPGPGADKQPIFELKDGVAEKKKQLAKNDISAASFKWKEWLKVCRNDVHARI